MLEILTNMKWKLWGSHRHLNPRRTIATLVNNNRIDWHSSWSMIITLLNNSWRKHHGRSTRSTSTTSSTSGTRSTSTTTPPPGRAWAWRPAHRWGLRAWTRCRGERRQRSFEVPASFRLSQGIGPEVGRWSWNASGLCQPSRLQTESQTHCQSWSFSSAEK